MNILIVDDEPNIRRILSLSLEGDGHRVESASNIDDAREAAVRRSFEVAFVDLRLGTTNGLDLIPGMLSDSPWMKIVVITGYAGVDTAVEAMRRVRLLPQTIHAGGDSDSSRAGRRASRDRD